MLCLTCFFITKKKHICSMKEEKHMNHTKSLPYLLVLFLLMMLSTVRLTEGYTLMLYIFVFAISVVLFSFVSSNNGFVFFLVLTIGIGIYHTGVAFYTKASNLNQMGMILSYFVVIVGIALLWLLFYLIKSVQKEHHHMQKKVETLEKFEKNEHVFTKTEFLARTTLLYTGMRRRGEQGYLLMLELDGEKKYIQSSLFHTMSQQALQSIRQEYDLVGKLSEHTLAILLQNTNEEGMKVVLTRLEENMKKELDLSLHPYTVNTKKLDEQVYQMLMKGEFHS